MNPIIVAFPGAGSAPPGSATRRADLPPFDPKLSPRAAQVQYALTTWAWGDKPDCWPSNRALQDLLGLSRRTIQRALDELERLGKIVREMVTSAVGWYRRIVMPDRLPLPRPLRLVTPPDDSADTTPGTSLAPPPRRPSSMSELGSKRTSNGGSVAAPGTNAPRPEETQARKAALAEPKPESLLITPEAESTVADFERKGGMLAKLAALMRRNDAKARALLNGKTDRRATVEVVPPIGRNDQRDSLSKDTPVGRENPPESEQKVRPTNPNVR